ncbi:MAG: DUF6624 domain-containing protein [Pseudomonadota bacterium]
MTPVLLAVALMFAPMGPPPTPPVISDAGRAVIGEWQAALDAVRVRQAQAGPPKTAGEAVSRMAELDREGEAATTAFADAGLDAADLAGVNLIAGFTLRRLAHDNIEALQARLPPGGWFRISRDGAVATHDAWWIVWRSEDKAFTATALKRMAPLARKGEVAGEDYARLYDRAAVEAGRPQVYGSYWMCREGQLILPDLAEPETVDSRRAKVRWRETLAATKARLKIGEPC